MKIDAETEIKIKAHVKERIRSIKENFNMPDSYYDGLEKGYLGCIEFLNNLKK